MDGKTDLKSNLTREFRCLIFLVLFSYSSAADGRAGGRTDLKSNLPCNFHLPFFSYSSAADDKTDLKSSLTLCRLSSIFQLLFRSME